jgi:hypothetical protein
MTGLYYKPIRARRAYFAKATQPKDVTLHHSSAGNP